MNSGILRKEKVGEKLYRTLDFLLSNNGYDIRFMFDSQEELVNDVYAYHNDLLTRYDSSKGSICNWLSQTLTGRYIRKYGASFRVLALDDYRDIPCEYEALSTPSTVPLLRPDFGRMYFLSDIQKMIAELYHGEEMTVRDIAERTGLKLQHIHSEILRINKKLKTKLRDPLEFYIYCSIDSFPDLSFLANTQEHIVIQLYGMGMSSTNTMKVFDMKSKDVFYKQLSEAKKRMREKWWLELEVCECIYHILDNYISSKFTTNGRTA
ncbi:sigma-70 family RNA polymerase sigma factor [Brevibacillus brevis]|uniref:sigma-70 family RNA polymerase sigma factor n=1 Tax=Brevibacillus brevis TaxID=1393 RepID=UPI000E39CBE1|nr:sigma-70 family RNA polymerase sigma factor [Brevibacillus brevis]RED28445.1 DNA-directed RNA polymerase specialized sigma24 family protein [Brevibacillus brevis]GEC90700.1 hypothetical protein BBR01nite_30310 [Brevibacillus brevis]VEF91140.1 RNA polymerase sigma factor, sigma-70 family [Brevibacillus brevis]